MGRLWRERRERLGATGRMVRRYVRSAPGTYLWLVILLGTTILLGRLSPEYRETFLIRWSTNLNELEHRPIRVLISSAFYIDGSAWWPYLLMYTVFHAPAERWLGTVRWLLVVLVAHVGATYISEGHLNWLIHHSQAPESARRVLDVGVSYALAGVQAVLVYKLVPRWRAPYIAALLVYYGSPMLFSGWTFTDLGHLSAVLLGFACYPVAAFSLRGGRLRRVECDGWDPAAWLRWMLAFVAARRD